MANHTLSRRCFFQSSAFAACAPATFFGASPRVRADDHQIGAQDGLSTRMDRAFQHIETAVTNGIAPGALALVADKDSVKRYETYGICDLKKKRAFTKSTLCWCASITKPVTVAAAMTLVDRHELSLDDKAEDFLPDFKRQKAADGKHYAFTIRNLMTHTSGLLSDFPTRQVNRWSLGGTLEESWMTQTIPDVVDTLPDTTLRFPPGERVAYSNSAMFVLARIMELVSKKPYANYVHENILLPLGMNDSSYAPAASDVPQVSPIYVEREGQGPVEIFRLNPELKITNTAADGGLFTHPADYIKFVQMFLRNKGDVLSRQSVKLMTTEQAPGYGLGWRVQNGVFTHSGSSGTQAWGDPAQSLGAVVFFQYRDRRGQVPRVREKFWESLRR